MRGIRISAATVAVALPLAFAANAQAGDLLVDSPADAVAGSNGACTLREAVLAANGSTLFPECGTPSNGSGAAGKDTIRFAPTITDIDLATVNTQLDIGSDVELIGPGVEVTNSAPASAEGRILKINAGSTVAISGVAITGGDVNGASFAAGGAINNWGNLTLTNVRIADSSATVISTGNTSPNAAGGGIYGDQGGSLTLDRVVVEDNQARVTSNSAADGLATATGGGIYSDGPLTLDRTTVDGNDALVANTAGADTSLASGGGIVQATVGALSVRRSTISRNSATSTSSVTSSLIAEGAGISIRTGLAEHRVDLSTVSGNTLAATVPVGSPVIQGGGLAAGGGISVTVISSTIADNGAAAGAEGANVSGGNSFGFRNTIIADPRGGPTADNCDELAGSEGFNLDDEGSCDLNHISQTDLVADPDLAALGDNGGPTETMLPSGPAVIDQGDDSEQSVLGDQRELGRPVDLPSAGNGQGDRSDVGAVEVQLPVTPGNPPTPATGGTAETGQRAAALKKCKKKKTKAKRKRCRKRAQLLPL
jgi:CSLREA domain-containing protein